MSFSAIQVFQLSSHRDGNSRLQLFALCCVLDHQHELSSELADAHVIVYSPPMKSDADPGPSSRRMLRQPLQSKAKSLVQS